MKDLDPGSRVLTVSDDLVRSSSLSAAPPYRGVGESPPMTHPNDRFPTRELYPSASPSFSPNLHRGFLLHPYRPRRRPRFFGGDRLS